MANKNVCQKSIKDFKRGKLQLESLPERQTLCQTTEQQERPEGFASFLFAFAFLAEINMVEKVF